MKSFSDIHCHPTLFPFLKQEGTPWVENKNIVYPSQADFIKLARGDVRLVFVSLYPVEQGFLDLELLKMHKGEVTDTLANLLLSIPEDKVNEIQSPEHDYFNDLLGEYELIRDHEGENKITGRGKNRKTFRYRIAGDFSDVKEILSLDENLQVSDPANSMIAVILTIEGGHSLGLGMPGIPDGSPGDLKDKVRHNITRLKSLGPDGQPGKHCPLFITLSHHFWNQLCGHCVSLPGMMNKIFDQKKGMNLDMQELGRFALDELIACNGSRRILIDTKHMPVEAKKWFYYTWLPEKERETGERIPVISSHSAASGWDTLDRSKFEGDSGMLHDIADARYDASREFNDWDINLSDEEIGLIHDSGGLIGLNMDKRILQGKLLLDRIKVNPDNAPGDLYYSLWAEPVVMNILHIAEVLYKKRGNVPSIWENIAIGSDFDGMISPLWAYSNAESFRNLDKMLVAKMADRINTTDVLRGKTKAEIRTIVDAVMWGNAVRFLERNFR